MKNAKVFQNLNELIMDTYLRILYNQIMIILLMPGTATG
jgi:hypothetical protein